MFTNVMLNLLIVLQIAFAPVADPIAYRGILPDLVANPVVCTTQTPSPPQLELVLVESRSGSDFQVDLFDLHSSSTLDGVDDSKHPDAATDTSLLDGPDAIDVPDESGAPDESDTLDALDALTVSRDSYIVALKSEYEISGIVYEYLSDLGWSDVIIAAVLGNMMTECGGQTLALQPFLYDCDNTYYGLCQWSLRYNSSIADCDVIAQLDYLTATIAKNMAYFGGDYEYFLSIESVTDAARYFNSYYEIGDNSDRRADNAATACAWLMASYTPVVRPGAFC